MSKEQPKHGGKIKAIELSSPGYECLVGGGEMGKLMRAHDWSQTPLGAVENWSQSLRSALSICLNSRFPIAIYWGADCLLLYNDAWRPIVGDKHPWSLGRPGREVWSEIWDVVGPELASVLETGEGIFHNDELLSMYRFGYTEECYFDYTFNPIQGEGGAIDGVLNIVSETTYRVLNDRRAHLLREIASKTGTAKTCEEACALMIEAIQSDPADIPFALLYLIDQDGRSIHLCGSTEVNSNHSVAPAVLDLSVEDTDGWPIARVVRTGQPHIITDVTTRFGTLPGSPWLEPPREAVVLPIGGIKQGQVSGVLVAVASPRRRLDENYQDFLGQVARHISTTIANARSYEEERQRAEQLAELDRAKTLFFSNVSHEFRTPLTLMLAPAEDALRETQDAEQRDRLELIHRNALRLQKLVNTLLDFSRIEAGRIEAVYEPTDLAQLTTDLAGVFRSAIERAGLQLRVDCPPLPEPVYVDREMWEKIVLNLLSNAFKFTFAGEISVKLFESGASSSLNSQLNLELSTQPSKFIVLEIQDTGIGIPATELPHIFERFRRVKGAQGRSYEGSGIGLSLVQELVKLHRGTVTVSSIEGQGTCFTVKLPLGSAHLSPDRIAVARSQASTATGAIAYIEEAQRWLPEGSTPDLVPVVTDGVLQSLAERPKPEGHLSQRIVLADDNADMREYIRRLLSQFYAVEAVANGRDALAAIQRQLPDLVLTDVMMPEMDGFELLRSLRSNSQTQAIPVILLSARAGEEASVEGLAAGADDYLTKPFSARELTARVEAALKLAQLRQTAMQQEQALRQEAEGAKQQIETILSGINDGFCVLDRNWCFTYVNDHYCTMVALPREALLGQNIWQLFPAIINTEAYEQFHQAMRDQTQSQFDFYTPWNCWYNHRIYPSPHSLTILLSDITERKRSELMLVEQKHLLEMIASGQTLEECLIALCHSISRLNPGTRACFLLTDAKRQTFPRSITPGMPPSFGQGLKDAPINDLCIGTCGDAVYRGQPVACTDIANDDRWSQEWRDLCVAHGIRACHSTPVMGIDNLPLGSLMLCFDTARIPTDWEYQLSQVGTQVASIVFERDRSIAAQQASEAQSQEILESINDGFFALDENWCYTYLNQAAATLLRRAVEDLTGKNIWKEQPGLIGSDFERVYRGAMYDRIASSATAFYPDHNCWYEVNSYPTMHGITVYFRDVSDRKQAELEREQLLARERQYVDQLQGLTTAALAINSALSVEQLLQVITNQAASIIRAHQSVTSMTINDNWAQSIHAVYLSDKYAQWRDYKALPDGTGIYAYVCRTNQPMRMTQAELEAHSSWRAFGAAADKHPPLRGWLAAPLIDRNGHNIGLLQLSDKDKGEFTQADESILMQLAQMASVAIENAQLYEAEQQARATAETSREEAQAANRVKDEFLAVLSHELRSPLNPILGWTKLMRSGRLDTARQEVALETIERNAKLQSQLIEDLLDISRIMRGKLTLTAAPVDLKFVISAAIETVRLAAEAKSIRLQIDLAPVTSVWGDTARLQQVVWNLLTNAVKFTPNGGQIWIDLNLIDHMAQLRVKDTGKGIQPQFLPHVFEYFRQEDGSTTRKFGGLGLGLAIARQIVEMHGGTIRAESLGENQGATFIVQLPLLERKLAADSHQEDTNTLQSETHSPLAGLQILVVDDDDDTREFQTFLLQQAGAKVTAATSGFEALQMLDQFIPDVLVSDIGMAEMDGYMLIQQVRSRSPEQGGKIPAIALTAYARDFDQQKALSVGFQAHITKPVEPDVLMATIVRLLA